MLVCTVKIVSIEKAGRRNTVYWRKKNKPFEKLSNVTLKHFDNKLVSDIFKCFTKVNKTDFNNVKWDFCSNKISIFTIKRQYVFKRNKMFFQDLINIKLISVSRQYILIILDIQRNPDKRFCKYILQLDSFGRTEMITKEDT